MFLREAEVDIKNNCYLKAVSASYFAIEHLLKALIMKEFGSIPSRVGSLFSLMDKLFTRKAKSKNELKHYRNLMIIVREIYNHRKDVDHLNYVPSRHEAEKTFKDAKLIISKLKVLLRT